MAVIKLFSDHCGKLTMHRQKMSKSFCWYDEAKTRNKDFSSLFCFLCLKRKDNSQCLMRSSKSTKPSISIGRHTSVIGENRMDSTAQNSNDIN